MQMEKEEGGRRDGMREKEEEGEDYVGNKWGRGNARQEL